MQAFPLPVELAPILMQAFPLPVELAPALAQAFPLPVELGTTAWQTPTIQIRRNLALRRFFHDGFFLVQPLFGTRQIFSVLQAAIQKHLNDFLFPAVAASFLLLKEQPALPVPFFLHWQQEKILPARGLLLK